MAKNQYFDTKTDTKTILTTKKIVLTPQKQFWHQNRHKSDHGQKTIFWHPKQTQKQIWHLNSHKNDFDTSLLTELEIFWHVDTWPSKNLICWHQNIHGPRILCLIYLKAHFRGFYLSNPGWISNRSPSLQIAHWGRKRKRNREKKKIAKEIGELLYRVRGNRPRSNWPSRARSSAVDAHAHVARGEYSHLSRSARFAFAVWECCSTAPGSVLQQFSITLYHW